MACYCSLRQWLQLLLIMLYGKRVIWKFKSDDTGWIANFSEDEQNGGPVNGVRRTLQQTEDSDPSSVFDSVFMSMSDTLNSINTLESSDQTPDDKPQNTTTDRIPLTQRDTTR